MICIRIFKTRKEAEWGRQVLETAGIHALITEDKFNNVPIQEFEVTARFRLLVEEEDYIRTAKYLAGKLKK